MKRFKHWLKIDGMWNEVKTNKAYQNLLEYIEQYPDVKITMFVSENNLFHRYFCLECSQSYNDLDLDCNSLFDGSLIHLNRKPANIELSTLTFFEKCQAVLSSGILA